MFHYRRRRTTYRRRSLKRKASPKKYYSRRYPVRKAIVSVAKKVKKIQSQIELKCNSGWIKAGGYAWADNTTYTGTPATTTLTQANPLSFLLNGLTRGTNNQTRIGDSVYGTSVHVKGQVYATSASTFGYDVPVRIMIVVFKRPRGQPLLISFDNTTNLGSNPALIGLFDVSGSSATPHPNTFSMVDTKNQVFNDYKVLYDRIHRLRNNVGTQSGLVNPFFNFDIKCKLSRKVDMSRNNNGDVGDFESNAVHLVFITDSNQYLSVDLDNFYYYKDA